MNQAQYEEMRSNLNNYSENDALSESSIFVFGHCEASLSVIDELLKRGYSVSGILDNSKAKQEISYKDIPVMYPEVVSSPEYNAEKTVVFLASRFYEQMNRQLRDLGFMGKVIKLVDYNTYSEYSLSPDTIERKRDRVRQGEATLSELKKRENGSFIFFFPFNALGDVYMGMEYLPEFIKKREIGKYVICVPSEGCAEVAGLFGAKEVVVLNQKKLDAAVQAAIHSDDNGAFIVHQDRPYVINLHKALSIKKIPLEDIYKTGIYGLHKDVIPVKPNLWENYEGPCEIKEGRAAILSPYAKSVTALPVEVWTDIVNDLKDREMQVFTNVYGDEKPLLGTIPISPKLCQMKSVVERAGLFIGIRSGLCDVLRTANCRKIALFPDYYYGDTKWKAIDMYLLDEFENIVVGEDFKWQKN